MPTRRTVLTQAMQASVAIALSGFTGLDSAQQAAPDSHPDEMTVNSAQSQRQPSAPSTQPPAVLPKEAEAVRGRHSLLAHAHKHGLLSGAAVVVHALENDPAMQQLIAEQYGIVVPENELKWYALRPAQGRFDFPQSDSLFAFASAHHLQVRGHTMVWHNSVPD